MNTKAFILLIIWTLLFTFFLHLQDNPFAVVPLGIFVGFLISEASNK